jgi:quinol monooxygenase YgiN
MTSGTHSDQPISVVVRFDVEPADQNALAAAVAAFARAVLMHRAGFRSAVVHRALDGRSVVNVVGWRSEADFQAYLAEPRTEPEAAAVVELSRPVSTPCVVAAVIEPQGWR